MIQEERQGTPGLAPVHRGDMVCNLIQLMPLASQSSSRVWLQEVFKAVKEMEMSQELNPLLQLHKHIQIGILHIHIGPFLPFP